MTRVIYKYFYDRLLKMNIPKGKYKNLKTLSHFFDNPGTSSQDVACNMLTNTSGNVNYPNKRYTFVKKLKDGSASIIHLAYDELENKNVIIKSIPKKEVWAKELDILKSLDNCSDKILKYLDFFESNRKCYIVTDFYEGFDLFEHVDINTPYDEKIGLSVSMEMAKCIKECHDLNIIHLDIKCENYMVNKKQLFKNNVPNIVLIDFGHAERIKGNIQELRYGYLYGTSFYLCPEGYKKIYSSKSDIWSLGVCMSLILTGDFPFSGKNEKEYLKNAKEDNVEFTKKLRKETEHIVKRCVANDPSKRPDINQVINFINYILSSNEHK